MGKFKFMAVLAGYLNPGVWGVGEIPKLVSSVKALTRAQNHPHRPTAGLKWDKIRGKMFPPVFFLPSGTLPIEVFTRQGLVGKVCGCLHPNIKQVEFYFCFVF